MRLPCVVVQPRARGAGRRGRHVDTLCGACDGGVVFMDGDLHFEVVLRRDGRHRLYFSDAVREDLPAATASGVTVTVTPKAGQPDTVALQIDDSGESWVGRGHQVADPEAIARVAYTVHGRPYFIDVPFPR